MNLKDTIAAISAEANIPAKQVRIVATALLERMAAAIESGDGFRSPQVVVRVRDVPERKVKGEDGADKTMPAQRVGVMHRAKKAASKETEA